MVRQRCVEIHLDDDEPYDLRYQPGNSVVMVRVTSVDMVRVTNVVMVRVTSGATA